MSLGRAGRSAAHGGNLFENELLDKIAKKYNVTIAQLLLKYQLQRGIIIVPKRKIVQMSSVDPERHPGELESSMKKEKWPWHRGVNYLNCI